MASNPLKVLKKGLKVLQDQVKAKKKRLQTQLIERVSISSEDERWLDHKANFADEEQVLDTLERASDYECGLERLSDTQKCIVNKLQEVAGDQSKAIGKKQKHACSPCQIYCGWSKD